MRENTDQKNSAYWHFLQKVLISNSLEYNTYKQTNESSR